MARAFAIDAAADKSDSEAKVDARTRLAAALRVHASVLRRASRLWVGFSGGADSTALLLTLTEVFPELEVRASHINHGVQPQAADWAQQCAALCARLKIPLDRAELQPPSDGRYAGGFEAWARQGRYRHWRNLLAENDLLLLGHHATDQRETVALKLLQGRMPIPMPEARSLAESVGFFTGVGSEIGLVVTHSRGPYLLRPWLGLPGSLTPEFLAATGQRWIEDPSNRSRQMLRNRVRLQLLPELARTSADRWATAIDRCGAFTQRLVLGLALSAPRGSLAGAGELIRLPLAALECPAALHSLIGQMPPLRGAKSSSRAQIEGALASLKQQRTAPSGRANRQGLPVGKDLTLWLAESELVLWREPDFEPLTTRLTGPENHRMALGHGTLTICGSAGCQLVIRPAQSGEQLDGQPLRERLRAAGVPRWARGSYPVISVLGPARTEADRVETICLPRYGVAPVTSSSPESDGPAPIGTDLGVEAWFESTSGEN